MRKVKIFLSILFSIIVVLMIGCGIGIDGQNQMSINKNEPHIILFISILAAGIIPLIYRLLKKIKKPYNFILTGIVGVCILVFQIFIIKDLGVSQDYNSWEDQWRVNTTAYSLVEGNGIPEEHFEYFSNFPHNLFITKTSQAALFIGKTLGLTNFLSYYQILMILNAIFIDISIILGILCLKRFFGKEAILPGTLLFGAMSVPIMLYIPICYTDTFSMPFIMAIFYLLIWGRDNLSLLGRKQYIIYGVVFGLLTFVAMSLKATSLILVIAASIFFLPKFKKKSLLVLAPAILIIIPFSLIWSGYKNTILDSTKKVPLTHWVMMSMSGNGNWSQQDYIDTFSAINSGEDVVQKNLNTISERFNTLGFDGYVSLLGRKISFTWGDGTFYAPHKLLLGNYNQTQMHKVFVAGTSYSKQTYKILNIVWLTALLLIGFYSIKSIFRDEDIFFSIIKLTIIGLFVFLLFWETRSRYVINYLPLIIILTFYSIRGIAIPNSKKTRGRDLKGRQL